MWNGNNRFSAVRLHDKHARIHLVPTNWDCVVIQLLRWNWSLNDGTATWDLDWRMMGSRRLGWDSLSSRSAAFSVWILISGWVLGVWCRRWAMGVSAPAHVLLAVGDSLNATATTRPTSTDRMFVCLNLTNRRRKIRRIKIFYWSTLFNNLFCLCSDLVAFAKRALVIINYDILKHCWRSLFGVRSVGWESSWRFITKVLRRKYSALLDDKFTWQIKQSAVCRLSAKNRLAILSG